MKRNKSKEIHTLWNKKHTFVYMKAPIIGVERHRIATDGQGVTTLVAFHGCPLRCKYCLNPQCFADATPYPTMTPQELYENVSVDNLYFLATGGGVTFGGGEPLLYSEFIHDFCRIVPQEWNICIETSLNVARNHMERLLPHIAHWYIDIKDMDDRIYRKYTGKSNKQVIENLKLLAAHTPQEHITIRLPLIHNYNNEKHREASINTLRNMGFENFDMLKYITPTP